MVLLSELPIGAIAMAIIYLQIPLARNAGTPLRDQISQMDPLGNLCFYHRHHLSVVGAPMEFISVVHHLAAGHLRRSHHRLCGSGDGSSPRAEAAEHCRGLSLLYSYVSDHDDFRLLHADLVSSRSAPSMMLPMVVSIATASLLTGVLIYRLGYYIPAPSSCPLVPGSLQH
jgi:hypothetical protein